MPDPTVTDEVTREDVSDAPEVIDEGQPDPAAPAPVVPPPTAPTAEQVAETNRILAQVLANQRGGGQKPASQEEMRAKIREKTGMSDEGIDWVMQLNRDSVVSAVAPLSEKVSWGELRSAKAGSPYPITKEIEDAMKEELKSYPAESRGELSLLEKVYLVQVGKLAIRKTPATPARPETPIIGRRIVTNNPPAGGAGGGGAGGEPKGPQLSVEEKTIARKMGVSEVDYAKYKGNPAINGPTAPK